VEILSRPVVITLDDNDAAVLAGQLAAMIQRDYRHGGNLPPRALRDFADMLSGAASQHGDRQASGRRGTAAFRRGPSLPPLSEPVRLTAREAAELARVSEGFMRRCCRRGDVQASRAHRGAWAVDIASLAAWISQRRKDHERSKAA